MTGSYSVRIKAGAEKDIRALPRDDRRRILERMQALAGNPRPPGCIKLAGTDAYRIRQGDYRILYTVDDLHRIVEVYRVRHRREVYR